MSPRPLFDPETEEGRVSGDPPDILYHYTSPKGLKGIVEEGTLRCSSAHHLNDTAELTYAVEQIKPHLTELEEKFREDDSVRPDEFELVTTMIGLLNQTRRLEVFVGSLSEHNDQLSQWRAYCPDSGGFAIGFDTERLLALRNLQAFHLFECLYKEEDYAPQMEDLIYDTVEAYRTHQREQGGLSDQDRRMHASSFLWLFLDLAVRIKHPDFAEEDEWRLVSSRRTLTEKSVESRIGPSTLVPYVNFQFNAADIDVPREIDQARTSPGSPITEIVVGPTPHQQLAKRSVQQLLESNGVYGVRVRKSETPYRTW